MMLRRNTGPAKVVVGILSIVVGSFTMLFGGIAFLFRTFGSIVDLSILTIGLILLFTGIWMTLNAFFSDVEVRVSNLDELAFVFGRRVKRCERCASFNAKNARFCAKCGAPF